MVKMGERQRQAGSVTGHRTPESSTGQAATLSHQGNGDLLEN